MKRTRATLSWTAVAAWLAACAPEPAVQPPAPAATPPPAAQAPKETGERDTLLVMPLRAEPGLEAAGRALDEMVLTAIHDLDRYRVLGPSDLNALLGVEQMKDAVGCNDVTCAAEIGGALGAPYLVAGQLGQLGSQAVLSLRLMDTRTPAVLERATARGTASGDALATMMASTVGGLFHIEIAPPETTDDGPAPVPAAASDYVEYTRIMTELGEQMANNEYSAMLADLERYERMTVATPESVDLAEVLTYYRITACSVLKRNACLRAAARTYLERWPRGMYAISVQTLVDQADDAQLHRDAATGELEKRLGEIRAMRDDGRLTDLQAQEMVAYAFFGARRYDRAARLFTKLLQQHSSDPDKAIEIVSILATVLEQNGEHARARAVLERARAEYPRLFRLNGLHHHLRRLPR